MIQFEQATTDEDFDSVETLFIEYMEWVLEHLSEEYGITFDVRELVSQDMENIEIFSPPHGRLLLVTVDSNVVGLGCLRKIGDGIGEIKRMYIQPKFRGKGYGRELMESLYQEAKKIGYYCLRLDSVDFMKAAHGLYRSFGFKEREPYPESEIPEDIHEYWVFMEKEI
jgi:GNAT superfamily N-acetyltransferase